MQKLQKITGNAILKVKKTVKIKRDTMLDILDRSQKKNIKICFPKKILSKTDFPSIFEKIENFAKNDHFLGEFHTIINIYKEKYTFFHLWDFLYRKK